ncbi:hypothetical protein [Burkholderia ubonensis]|uniref:Uncharacterized protein n=1 Tax=Burkholderia ubonensis TaxID=101571 RepID=A0AAW3NGS1_9BURK|nr:hypothetical protein [Burkholderia ubonensis]KVT57850.1 hypothetical protein WK53_27695 [Burkholderia ubonensis]
MSSKDDGTALGMVLIAGVVAWGLHAGWFYQTGQQWFDSCWASINSKNPPATAAEATAWMQCEPQTKKALFNAGYVFGGNPEYAVTPELKAVEAACPSNYSDIPMSGVQVMAIDLLTRDGGPRWLDKFMPPDQMIVRAFNKRWPNCSAARAANGFPTIVQKADGTFGWSGPCKPCEAENAAMGK